MKSPDHVGGRGLGRHPKSKGPRWFERGPCLLGSVKIQQCLMSSPPFPKFPLVFSQDHPRARTGRNRGNCDAWRQHPL